MRLAPALVVVLVIVMVVVIGPHEPVLVGTGPVEPSVHRLLTWRLLRDDGGAVDVVVLHVRGLDLINGVDGDGVLQAAVGHSAVQQRLGYDGGRHSGDVVRNPGLHVLVGTWHVVTLKQQLAQLQ